MGVKPASKAFLNLISTPISNTAALAHLTEDMLVASIDHVLKGEPTSPRKGRAYPLFVCSDC